MKRVGLRSIGPPDPVLDVVLEGFPQYHLFRLLGFDIRKFRREDLVARGTRNAASFDEVLRRP